MSEPYPQQPAGQPAVPGANAQPTQPAPQGVPQTGPAQPVPQGIPQAGAPAQPAPQGVPHMGPAQPVPQGFAPGYAPVPQGPVKVRVNYLSLVMGIGVWEIGRAHV